MTDVLGIIHVAMESRRSKTIDLYRDEAKLHVLVTMIMPYKGNKLWSKDLSHSVHYELGNQVSYNLGLYPSVLSKKKTVQALK